MPTSPPAPSASTPQPSNALRAQLLSDADQCVKCAICLPHCPTYALHGDESESPRGRISLMQGLLTEQLECSDTVQLSLNNCLNCGRCERACPAQVPFTRLIDGVRGEFSADLRQRSRQRYAAWLTSSGRLKLLARLQRIARTIRLARWPLIPARWRHYLQFARPKITPLVQPHKQVEATEQLVMMAGCLNNAFEPDVADSVRMLTQHAGFSVEEPSPAQCCGALALHAGDPHAASCNAKSLVAAYSRSSSPLVVLPSGCQRGVLDVLANEHTPEATQLASRVIDLYDLLSNAFDGNAVFADNDTTVSLYLPCTVSKAESASLKKLLSLVPGAKIESLHTPYGCCGAAGDHMLTSPTRAAQFAAPLVAQLAAAQNSVKTPSCLLIPNTGCVWHLRAELAVSCPELPVSHPLQWLARCLHTSSDGSAKLSP